MLLKGKEIDFTNAPILLISLLIIVMIEWKEDEGQWMLPDSEFHKRML